MYERETNMTRSSSLQKMREITLLYLSPLPIRKTLINIKKEIGTKTAIIAITTKNYLFR